MKKTEKSWWKNRIKKAITTRCTVSTKTTTAFEGIRKWGYSCEWFVLVMCCTYHQIHVFGSASTKQTNPPHIPNTFLCGHCFYFEQKNNDTLDDFQSTHSKILVVWNQQNTGWVCMCVNRKQDSHQLLNPSQRRKERRNRKWESSW